MDFETPRYNKDKLDSQRQEELGEVRLQEPLSIDLETLAAVNFPHGRFLRTSTGDEYILDENGRTIVLGKVGDSKAGFSSLYSPLPPKELRRELLCLPKPQQDLISKVLGLPEPDQTDAVEFERKQKEREQETELLDEALRLPSAFDNERKERTVKVDQRLVRGIVQKEYAITDAESDKPIVGTFGLGPCIALTIYNRATRVAGIVHIDGTTNVDSLDRMFSEFQQDENSSGNPLELRLIGGDSSSRKLAIKILKYLKSRGREVTSTDILEKKHPSAFVMDSRDGRIIPNVSPIDNGEEEALRMQASGLAMNAQIKKEFDGRIK